MSPKNQQTRNELASQMAKDEKAQNAGELSLIKDDNAKRMMEAAIASAKDILGGELVNLTADAVGWLTSAHYREATPIIGILKGARLYEAEYNENTKKTRYGVGYTVELAVDVKGERAIGDPADPPNYSKGQNVIVGERFALRGLRDLAMGSPIVIVPVEKVDIANGKRSVWRSIVKGPRPVDKVATPHIETMRDMILDSYEAIKNGASAGQADPWEVDFFN